MTKASKAPNARSNESEYAFSMGVRGKYAGRFKESAVKAEAMASVRIWAPLADFRWAGSEWQVAEDTWIRTAPAYQGYEYDEYFISKEERDRCRGTRHWLSVVQPAHHQLSAKASVNSFLIALWIVRPTRTHVPLRFEETDSGVRTVARVLDRFQWIKGQAAKDVGDTHLRKVTEILPAIRAIYSERRRLRNALVLTFRGCVSMDWQAAFVCFASAVEAMLTYSKGPGIADRLAAAYGKLIGGSQLSVEGALEEFKRLYAIRSDIIHGRAYGRGGSAQNLRAVADFSDTLRRLWQAILERDQWRDALEGSDKERETFLANL